MSTTDDVVEPTRREGGDYRSPTYESLGAMDLYGGSFVRTLAALYHHADPVNRAILCEAFAHYFHEYDELALARAARTGKDL